MPLWSWCAPWIAVIAAVAVAVVSWGCVRGMVFLRGRGWLIFSVRGCWVRRGGGGGVGLVACDDRGCD